MDEQVLVAGLERLGATRVRPMRGGDAVEFWLEGSPGIARRSASSRIRGHVLIGPWTGPGDPHAEAVAWLKRQPSPVGCRLMVSSLRTAVHGRQVTWVRARFERPLDLGRIADDDPLPREVAALNEAFRLRDLGVAADLNVGGSLPVDDPGAIAPANAWLVSGNQSHWFAQRVIYEAKQEAASGIFDQRCPAKPGVRPGDLLFFYLTTPFRAVYFVTRAVTASYEATHRQRDGSVRKGWFVEHTPPLNVLPVRLAELRELTGKRVFRGVHRLDAEVANQLIQLIDRPRDARDAAELLWVLQPVGADA